MIEVKGTTATVQFDGQSVRLIRGRMSSVGKGEKVIPVKSIAAVQWKPNTWTTKGYIQFTVPGGNESRASLGSGTMDAMKDENSVVFGKKVEPDFQALREAVEAAIQGSPPGIAADTTQAGNSVADRLAQLTALRDQGLVSTEQFEAKQEQILGDL